MNFTKTVITFAWAGQPVVWVRTHEGTESRRELLREFAAESSGRVVYQVYRWSLLQGLRDPQGNEITLTGAFGNQPLSGSAAGFVASVPLFLKKANDAHKDPDGNEPEPGVSRGTYINVLLVDNFHHMANENAVIQALQDFSSADRQNVAVVVVLAHYDQQVPGDLKSYVAVVDHDLPRADELKETARSLLLATNPVSSQSPGSQEEAPDVCDLLDSLEELHIGKIANAGLGLSRLQFESGLSFSLTAIGQSYRVASNREQWNPNMVADSLVQMLQDRKAALFNAEGLVRLYRTDDRMEDLAGFEGIKNVIKSRFDRQDTRHNKGSHPKGIILLGPPGTAKSTLARAIGNWLGRLTAVVDPGALKQGIVGASEGRIRRMFQVINAMGAINVFVDEIEKVFPTGDELDSGVSSDMQAVWLTNLSDPNRQYYVIASANSVHKLPAPLLRNGRFDHTVMVDVPRPDQQLKIWEICKRRYGIPEDMAIPAHTNWTGAEISACCEQADALGVSLVDAARRIVPIVETAPEAIQAVRDYAHAKALDAETGYIYRKPGTVAVSTAPVSTAMTPGTKGRRPQIKPPADPGLN